jgi:hypothetical protein
MGYYQTSSIHRKELFIHLFTNKFSKKREYFVHNNKKEKLMLSINKKKFFNRIYIYKTYWCQNWNFTEI